MPKPTKNQIAEAQNRMAEIRRNRERDAWFSMVQLINEKLLDPTPFYMSASYGVENTLHVWIDGHGDECTDLEGESAIDFIRGVLAMRGASK